MPTPDLPQTEEEVRGVVLTQWAVMARYWRGPRQAKALRFLREYGAATEVLQQDPVTAYAAAARAAARAVEQRAKR